MLEYKNVEINYLKEQILKNISVTFPKGKVTTILGPNGCGKTTLLRTLIGGANLKSGKILLDGKDFFHLSSKERARGLAFLPQVRTTIPILTTRSMVSHGRFPYMKFGKIETRKDKEMIRRAMEYTKVKQYEDVTVDTLSGGVRQRVFLATILAQDTPYIVLDEPTTYLDLKGQREFLSLIKDLKKSGKTIIMVLHDLNQALEISDEVILMDHREIVFKGTVDECVKSKKIEEIFHVECKIFSEDGKRYFFFQ